MNNCLTLSDEFLQYCKLNGIGDVEKFALQVFTRGFNLVKYGSQPVITSSRPLPPPMEPLPQTQLPPNKPIVKKTDNLYGD